MTEIKIGEVNLGKFKTEFKITTRVKKYLEKEKISLAGLLLDGWTLYELRIFEKIDGIKSKKLGTKFIVVYNKITESLGWTKEHGLETSGFEEKVESKKIISSSSIKLKSIKNPKKEFAIGYTLMQK